MDHKKRVVVTGMGVVSAFGNDVDEFYKQLLAGKSGVRLITRFPCEEYPTRFAASVPDFDASDYIDKKQVRRIDRFITFAMVAGKKALEMAGLTDEALEALNKRKCGIIMGSGMGGLDMLHTGTTVLATRGHKRLTPFFIPFIITNMAGGLLAIDLEFRGPNYSISTACATGTHSIIAAMNHIRSGEADVMICGGSEAAVSPIGLAGFVANKALSERNDDPEGACRPWDKDRDGFVMGEGAGALVLESLEHALARGANIIGEVLGGSSNCDAYHITALREDGSGISDCIEAALENADIEKERVNYINAHATSTPLGDMVEVAAIHQVFGSHAKNLKMNATKSLIGHCLGAAGAMEAIVVLMAIREGEIHPTLNLKNREELGGIDPVAGKSQKHAVDVAISNSFGFGGHNAALVFGKYHP